MYFISAAYGGWFGWIILRSFSSSPSAQTVSDSDNLCDIYGSAERAKVVFVPCGHSRFCQACADRCFGSPDKNVRYADQIGRSNIDMVISLFNFYVHIF